MRHHFVPPGQTVGTRPWTAQTSLDQMEKFGIAVAILSMTHNGDLSYDGTPKGRAEIRRWRSVDAISPDSAASATAS